MRAAVRIQTTWLKRAAERLRSSQPEIAQHTRLVNAEDGRPATMHVDVALNVMSLHSIDTVEQRFSCE